MNKEDLGKKFYRDGKIYEAIAYSDNPTIELKNVDNNDERISVVIGSEYSKEFQPLEEIQVLSRCYPPKEDEKIDKLQYCMVDGCIVICGTRDIDEQLRIICESINEIIDKVNGEDNERN